MKMDKNKVYGIKLLRTFGGKQYIDKNKSSSSLWEWGIL